MMTQRLSFALSLLQDKGPLFCKELKDELIKAGFNANTASVRCRKTPHNIRRTRFAGRACSWNSKYKDVRPIIIYYLNGQEQQAYDKIEKVYGPLHSNRKKEITITLGLWRPHQLTKKPFESKWK